MFSDNFVLSQFREKSSYNDDQLINMFRQWLSSYKINKYSENYNYPNFDYISYALNFIRNNSIKPNIPDKMIKNFNFRQFVLVCKNSDIFKDYSAKILIIEKNLCN